MLALAGVAAACAPPPGANEIHETCKDVQDAALADTGKNPSNGTYTLYFEGDETKPWEAYCDGMNRASPREYITVDSADNYSQISDAHVFFQTSYRRIRIDPDQLELILDDDAFATNGGDLDASAWITSSGLPGDSLPPAHAIRVPEPAGAPSGDRLRANARLDLSDTAFELDIDVEGDLCKSSDAMATDLSTIELSGSLRRLTLVADNSDRTQTSTVAPECTNLGASTTLPLRYAGDD